MLQNVRLKILILNFLNDFSDLAEYDAMINASSAHLNIPPQNSFVQQFFWERSDLQKQLKYFTSHETDLSKALPRI